MGIETFTPTFWNLLGAIPEAEKVSAAAAGPRNGAKITEEVEKLRDKNYHDDPLGGSPEVSALDMLLPVTIFRDVKARSAIKRRISLRQLEGELRATHAVGKSGLPLLKLAEFGTMKTPSGSLRHDGNMLTVSGIEGDYDAGQVAPELAAARLRAEGVAALIYTSTHHTAASPRWRVLAPLSGSISPAERDGLCARLNGALGGGLGGESFTRSQSFYYGQAEARDESKGGGKAAPIETILIEGQPIDKLPRIRGIWPGHKIKHKLSPEARDLLGLPEDRPATEADDMEKRHLQKIIADKAGTPAAANNMLRMVHLLMRHAVDLGWRGDDPTQGVRKVKHKTGGFLTWNEPHIASFIATHAAGTRAYLALSLLLYTGQRRSDVVRMGHQHVRRGILSIVQQKTGQDVHIPLHPALKAILDSLPAADPAFLMTVQGRPFTPAGFTNWFRDTVREAGLPDGLSPHGLRKATCRRLAEAGCTPHQIMALSGHKSLSEVTRYTVAAGRKELAAQAMLALGKTTNESETVKPIGTV